MVSSNVNTNNSISYELFICTQLNGFKYWHLTLIILYITWFQVELTDTNNSISY